MNKTAIMSVLAFLALCSICLADELLVPGQYPDIQSAIYAANNGDEVIVSPGVYLENVSFKGKNITLRSINPSSPTIVSQTVISKKGTIIDANSDGKVSGFTIRNPDKEYAYGINCSRFSPTISHCMIMVPGNGITGYIPYQEPASQPIVENNIIYISMSTGIYLNCQAYAQGGVNAIIRNNVIFGNPWSTGILYRGHKSKPIISGNIITNCKYGIEFTYSSLEEERKALISYNNVWGNEVNYISGKTIFDLKGIRGNISEDPLFFNSIDGDFHLLNNSPCINSGDPNFIPGPDSVDIDGDPRVMEGRVDIGADEFNPELGLPVRLEIVGPNDVVENSPTQYTASAYYEDGSTRNATSLVIWSVKPQTFARIDENGVLWTEDVNEPQDTVIYARGTIEAVPLEAEMSVHIHLSNTWYVPLDYETIQAAVNAAEYSDTIIVDDGIYTGPGNRDIDFLGKAITVCSENGPENCIIDCENSSRGFYFHNNEDANSVLAGLTITNCDYSAIHCNGASPTITNCIIGKNSSKGIYCNDSSPTINNCIINGNSAKYGGGIYCSDDSSPTITNCVISGNTAERDGGGIYCSYFSSPTITNCIISGNIAGDEGGGIYCEDYSSPKITNCTITSNSANHEGGGIYCGYDSSPKIINCIFWNNAAQTGKEIYGRADVTYSDVQGGYWGEGNIKADPLLTPDGHLQAYSPCIDAGDPDFIPELGQVDIDGQPRIMGGRVDMGADEVTAPLVSTIVLSSSKFYFHVNEDGPNPQPQILSIRNILDDTLSWEVTEDCPWLEIYPNTGFSTYEPNYVTLSVDITGLVTGAYNCTLTISSPNAANSPRTVAVTLYVYNLELLLVPVEYPTIQSAIDAAVDGDTVTVTTGVYTGEGNLDIDFLGKAITVRSADPNDPNIVSATIIDCAGTDDEHRGFYFHNNEDANSVLSGLTITNCDDRGIYCSDANPTITNCIISNNSESGIYCYYYSNPTITNCIIIGNTADFGGGICCLAASPIITNCIISGNTARWGGGIYCGWENSPKITNCTINGNTADEGGGIYCEYCISPTITNCIISGNSAIRWHGRGKGGGIYYDTVDDPWDYEEYIFNPKITSCIITGNTAGENGGGVYLQGYGSIKMTNCTITGNSAEDNGGGIWCEDSSPAITNSIVWGNADSSGQGQSAQLYDGKPNVWFSCIQDDNPDDANIPFGADNFNIDDDPCFVDPGSWDANGLWLDGDYHLLPDSPCIETGDPYSTYHAGDVDMDAQPRLMGQRVDMGADEFELSTIVVTKPKGGEVWTGGSTHEIKWDSYNISGTVDIYYSTNNGADWIMIDNAPDTGSFTWHLPDTQFSGFWHKLPLDSNQCLVLVEPNTPVTNLTCIESGLFTIQPYRSWPPMPWWPKGPQMKFGPELGCVKWKFQTDGPVTAAVAIGYHNRVYIPCEDGKLYTLNTNGRLLWTYDTNSPLVSSPAVDRSGNVYVGAENGKLYAINRRGRLLWTHTTDGPIYSSPVVCPADHMAHFKHWHPMTANSGPWKPMDRIFVSSQDGTLYALAQDGSELWNFQTDGISAVTSGAIFASPAVDHNGNTYIAGVYDPNLYALDSNDGSVKWNRNFSDPCDPTGKRPWPFASTVVAEDGTIYQTLLYDPNLYAIDPNDGSIIWSTSLASLALWYGSYPYGGYIIWYGTGEPPEYVEVDGQWHHVEHVYPYIYTSGWSKPALAPDGTIYVSFGDPYLRAVNPDGSIKWATRLGMMGGFTLTVGSDGLIYAASDDGCLYVVDSDGEEIARFEGGGELSFPTIAAGRTIIVSDANNAVWAISRHKCWGRPLALHQPEDLNGDRTVNSIDLAVLAADWLDRTDTYWPSGFEEDQVYHEGGINKDLYVNFADLEQLANR